MSTPANGGGAPRRGRPPGSGRAHGQESPAVPAAAADPPPAPAADVPPQAPFRYDSDGEFGHLPLHVREALLLLRDAEGRVTGLQIAHPNAAAGLTELRGLLAMAIGMLEDPPGGAGG